MKKFRLSPQTIPIIASVAVLIALYVGGCFAFDNFGSLRVLINLFGDNAFLGVAGIGITCVIRSGGVEVAGGGAAPPARGRARARRVTRPQDPVDGSQGRADLRDRPPVGERRTQSAAEVVGCEAPDVDGAALGSRGESAAVSADEHGRVHVRRRLTPYLFASRSVVE